LTSFDQIARLATALGGRVAIESPDAEPPGAVKKPRQRKATMPKGNW
jgi:hypothetical protein